MLESKGNHIHGKTMQLLREQGRNIYIKMFNNH